MILPKNYSIWLAVDYNGIEKAFWYKPKRCKKMENGGVIKCFFRMEALRNSSEENLLGMTNLLNLKKKIYADSYHVTLDANFQDDLGCDSLDAIEILMEAEREFGVTIPDDRIEHIKTVREAIDLIMELDSI